MKRFFALLLAVLMTGSLCACAHREKPQQEDPQAPEKQSGTQKQQKIDLQMPDYYGLGWNEPCTSAMGTGGKASGTEPGVLSACMEYWDIETTTIEEDGCRIHVPKLKIKGFKNLLLQETLKKDAQAVIDDLLKRRPSTDDLADRIAEHGAASADAQYCINIFTWAVGDLLCVQSSAALTTDYSDAAGSWKAGEVRHVYADTLYYNLADGHRMKLSELFADNVDYMSMLNEAVKEKLVDYELARPFTGLPDGYKLVSVTPYGVQIELTDRCPYVGGNFGYEDRGSILYVDLSRFWREMPILWGDCSKHFEDLEIVHVAPAWYELEMTPNRVELPSSGGEQAFADMPRIREGVSQEIREKINTALSDIENGLLAKAKNWSGQLSPSGQNVWCWADPMYNFAGPYFHVIYVLEIGANEQKHHVEDNAIFDLRTGERITLRDFIKDAKAAKESLLSQGLTDAQAEQVLGGADFSIGSMLAPWGSIGIDDAQKSWTLNEGCINLSLFEEK